MQVNKTATQILNYWWSKHFGFFVLANLKSLQTQTGKPTLAVMFPRKMMSTSKDIKQLLQFQDVMEQHSSTSFCSAVWLIHPGLLSVSYSLAQWY